MNILMSFKDVRSSLKIIILCPEPLSGKLSWYVLFSPNAYVLYIIMSNTYYIVNLGYQNGLTAGCQEVHNMFHLLFITLSGKRHPEALM